MYVNIKRQTYLNLYLKKASRQFYNVVSLGTISFALQPCSNFLDSLQYFIGTDISIGKRTECSSIQSVII